MHLPSANIRVSVLIFFVFKYMKIHQIMNNNMCSETPQTAAENQNRSLANIEHLPGSESICMETFPSSRKRDDSFPDSRITLVTNISSCQRFGEPARSKTLFLQKSITNFLSRRTNSMAFFASWLSFDKDRRRVSDIEMCEVTTWGEKKLPLNIAKKDGEINEVVADINLATKGYCE